MKRADASNNVDVSPVAAADAAAVVVGNSILTGAADKVLQGNSSPERPRRIIPPE